MKSEKKEEVNIPQTQTPPGSQEEMKQQPVSEKPEQQSSYKLKDKIAFLASDDSSYMTGQVLHPNGGEIING